MPLTWTAVKTRENEVTIWQSEGSYVRLSVHRHIHTPKDVWLLSCRNAPFDCRELKAKDIETAKREAVALVRRWCRTVLDELKGE